MTSERPLATVVVVNYNGRRYLDDCFSALALQELEGSFETIMVDNGSKDDSIEYMSRCHPDVRLLTPGRNLGFAGGNNLGIAEARGDYIVLLNNDTRVRPGWLRELVSAAQADPEAGAIASKLVLMDPPGIINNAGSMLLSDGSGADRGWQEEDRGQYDTKEEVFGACGNGVLLKREMLEDVGLLDETFFTYYEDTDLNWRLRLRGWRVIYQPTAVVEHVHAGTSGEWSPFFIFHVDRNRLFMILKNAGPGLLLGTFGSFAWMSLSNALRAMLAHVPRASGRLAGSNLGAGRARIHLKVLLSLLWHLPEMLVKRWRIRRRRRVSDREIARWFYPRELWDRR